MIRHAITVMIICLQVRNLYLEGNVDTSQVKGEFNGDKQRLEATQIIFCTKSNTVTP